MTETEATRIAAAINQLRPDWPAASIRTLIVERLGNRPRRDVTVALAWIACEAASRTPARVLEAGPWWRAAAVETADDVRRPVTAAEVCGKHPGQPRANCGGCASDQRAKDRASKPPGPVHHDRESALKAMREAMR